MPQQTTEFWNMIKSCRGRIRWAIIALYFAPIAMVGSWCVSEVRWAWINSPDGRFGSLSEYLQYGRYPERVSKVRVGEDTYFVAYSPMDTWLAVPSGPAAYVFDARGRLVAWSHDIGDDPDFLRQWSHSREHSSIEELEQTVAKLHE